MRRIRINPRPDWQAIVESQGFHFHTPGDQPYWDESAYYEFTTAEIDLLEKATYELNDLCLAAVQKVIDHDLFEQFLIPPQFVPWIKQSWEQDEHSIYGRFDLAYDGKNPPKLLEYNADTPTSLLEASVIQWHWMKQTHPSCDQFNSIHERLIEAWQSVGATTPGTMYFTCLNGNLEDFMTVTYLRDTANQAGLQTAHIDLEAIGWNFDRRVFVDQTETPISHCFKLYPWEWMVRERFALMLMSNTTRWLEAPWKMILSNKAILPLLWETFPQSPYLLACGFAEPDGDYVRKPIFSREGANVRVTVNGQTLVDTDGIYGAPFVYQKFHALPVFDGNYPVVGSWLVNGYACGIGIREDRSPVTQNASRFVPHVFKD